SERFLRDSGQIVPYTKVMGGDFGDSGSEFATMGFDGWHGRPPVMERYHRHNEVELNYVEEGSVTYVSGARQATVLAGQIAVFWAAIPHRLARREEPTTFYWFTLPLAWFLQWRLSELRPFRLARGGDPEPCCRDDPR
ncbi:MAG: AraC family ligand binding domain-containing protein, partial [Rubrobacter sp.]